METIVIIQEIDEGDPHKVETGENWIEVDDF